MRKLRSAVAPTVAFAAVSLAATVAAVGGWLAAHATV